MKWPRLESAYVRNLVATLVGRYGSKALEALVYFVAMRSIRGEGVGLVFVANAASALAFRPLDLGVYPVLVRSAARRELDPSTYAFLLRNRAIGVALITALFAGYSAFTRAENALLLTGFFFANGLPVVHELPRAVMAGHERFESLARMNLVTKAIESAIATTGLLLGFGLPAWLFGRLVAHLVFVVIAARFAAEELGDDVIPTKGTLGSSFGVLRQGFVFFLTRLLDVASSRVGVLLVTAHAGLNGAAQLGLSSKIHMAVLGLLGAATQIAYPRLARDRERAIGLRPMLILLGLSMVLGLGVYVSAPLAVRVLVGRWDPVMISVVRTAAPVLTMVAVSRPLELWLEAKDHERAVLAVAALSSVVSIASTAWLVRSMGVIGAGYARVMQSSFEALATVLVVAWVVRRARRALSPPAAD